MTNVNQDTANNLQPEDDCAVELLRAVINGEDIRGKSKYVRGGGGGGGSDEVLHFLNLNCTTFIPSLLLLRQLLGVGVGKLTPSQIAENFAKPRMAPWKAMTAHAEDNRDKKRIVLMKEWYSITLDKEMCYVL